jgi:hypothetical protein
MKEVRAVKLEKYMEISIDGSLVKTKFKFNDMFNDYVIGLDLSRDANIFYGIRDDNSFYEFVKDNNFDNYVGVFRLLNWSKIQDKEEYFLRCLKSNMNEKVDFEEEKEYLKCKLL